MIEVVSHLLFAKLSFLEEFPLGILGFSILIFGQSTQCFLPKSQVQMSHKCEITLFLYSESEVSGVLE